MGISEIINNLSLKFCQQHSVELQSSKLVGRYFNLHIIENSVKPMYNYNNIRTDYSKYTYEL